MFENITIPGKLSNSSICVDSPSCFVCLAEEKNCIHDIKSTRINASACETNTWVSRPEVLSMLLSSLVMVKEIIRE